MARVVFFGSPEFAVPSLRALASSSFRPELVVTQPDRPAGRGKKDRATPIKALSQDLGLPVITTSTLKDTDIIERLRRVEADFFIVAAFGLIFPKKILAIPKIDCINVHASLLPAWRGASPVNMAVAGGDSFSGISIMRMVKALDAGPVFSQEIVPVDPMEDAGSLSERLAQVSGPLLVRTLSAVIDGGIEPVEQPEGAVSYAPLLKKEDGLVPWELDVMEVHDHIRGMNPWPGSSTWHGEDYLKILKARPAGTLHGGQRAGEIVFTGDGGIFVACGSGILKIERLQAQGRKPLGADEFLRGHGLAAGDILGRKEDE